MFRIASLTTAAVLAAGSAAAAPIEARIPYGDLDLSSRAGATAFDNRVQRIARNLCTGRRPVVVGEVVFLDYEVLRYGIVSVVGWEMCL